MEKKYKNSKKKNVTTDNFGKPRSRVLSLAQLLSRVRKQRGNNSYSTGIQSASSNQKKNQSVISAQKNTLRLNNSGKMTEGSQERNMSLLSTGTRNEVKSNFVQGAFGRVGQNQKSQRNGQLGKQNSNLQRDKMNVSFNSNSFGVTSGSRKNQTRMDDQKRLNATTPIIRPKTLVIVLVDKPKIRYHYNPRIIDYRHSGLLQRYIGLGGKILPRRQTRLTAKKQRYIAKTIKTARIMGLLPFVSKEKGFFR